MTECRAWLLGEHALSENLERRKTGQVDADRLVEPEAVVGQAVEADAKAQEQKKEAGPLVLPLGQLHYEWACLCRYC